MLSGLSYPSWISAIEWRMLSGMGAMRSGIVRLSSRCCVVLSIRARTVRLSFGCYQLKRVFLVSVWSISGAGLCMKFILGVRLVEWAHFFVCEFFWGGVSIRNGGIFVKMDS